MRGGEWNRGGPNRPKVSVTKATPLVSRVNDGCEVGTLIRAVRGKLERERSGHGGSFEAEKCKSKVSPPVEKVKNIFENKKTIDRFLRVESSAKTNPPRRLVSLI